MSRCLLKKSLLDLALQWFLIRCAIDRPSLAETSKMLSDQTQHLLVQTKAEHQEQDDKSKLSDSSENPAEEKKGVVPMGSNKIEDLLAAEQATAAQLDATISLFKREVDETQGDTDHISEMQIVTTPSVVPLYIEAREEKVAEECPTGVQDSAKIGLTPCGDHLTEGPNSHRPREGKEPITVSGSKVRTERNPDKGADVGKRSEEATKRGTKGRNSVLAKTAALETFESSDLVVLVTGLSGAGRSQFINDFLGHKRMKVADSGSTLACTTAVDYYVKADYPEPGQRVVIVDTPGFNDCYKPDSRVLQEITNWICTRFPKGVGRAGVLYLHDITNMRYEGISRLELAFLRGSFGASEEVCRRIVLVTTKWNRISHDEGRSREDEIIHQHWQSLVERGSEVRRYVKEQDAQQIVNDLLLLIKDDNSDDLNIGIKKARDTLGTDATRRG